jgi:DHA1 family inner membrane transport protein
LTALAGLPTLQGRVIAIADGAPNLAAASLQAAFNIANSLGAHLGGLSIAAGVGYGSPNLVAALLVAAGLILAIGATRVARRQAEPAEPAEPAATALTALTALTPIRQEIQV